MPPKSRKRALRERAVAEELSSSLTSGATVAAAKSNDEIYFVDNNETISAKKAKVRAKVANAKVYTRSETDDKLVGRFKDKIANRARNTAPMEDDSLVYKNGVYDDRKRQRNNAPLDEDLWGDAEDDVYASEVVMEPTLDCNAHKKSNKKKTKELTAAAEVVARLGAAKAVGGVAHAGQSYNPRLEDQQALVLEGTNIETKKILKEKETKDWWARRRAIQAADASAQLLIEDDDDESAASSNSEDEEEEGRGVMRATERITKSKRNKTKRKRVADLAIERKSRLKALRVDIDEARRIRREMEAANTVKKEKMAEIEVLKKATLLAGPALTAPRPVGLSDELSGELRSTKAVMNPGAMLLELQNGCKQTHEAFKKKKEPKKQRRLKYRGARYLPRYKNPFEAPG